MTEATGISGYDATTDERRRALLRSLGDSFVANGFERPNEHDLHAIWARGRLIHSNPRFLTQDTGGLGRENTRKPVEKFLAAMLKAQEAFD
ncbi:MULTISPECIES: hypothetical protein [Methylosinus]|uniref:Uncharacterized protein n=1 Tax=Methylosinus trichosporium (strain ATCC 35070 / NCIMB 11131 / UNIQEM 75 / OB3b) TaxID=595536 RepID=A0A2D2CW34_METT3|nr:MULTISPECIES: hypothetical protein [Methylosinus]ATQ66884.1 hypothetical protein CQW49_02470 [Methylosinus trichosporium OB3b]OBS54152.1 hypothetical protein A8B73_02670 [Methylosinus sp. 3S-1]